MLSEGFSPPPVYKEGDYKQKPTRTPLIYFIYGSIVVMAFTTWKATLSVKVEQLDQQHKRLVDMINDLYEAMKAGTGKETTETILSELIDYTLVHFADEERLLTQHGYPEIADHIVLHEVFTRQVMEYDNKIKTGCSVLTLELMMFLQTWLVGHIKCEDMKFSQFLNANGVK